MHIYPYMSIHIYTYIYICLYIYVFTNMIYFNRMNGVSCHYGIKIYSSSLEDVQFLAGGIWPSGIAEGTGCDVLQADVSLWPGMDGNPPLFVEGPSFGFQLIENTGEYKFHAYPILDKSFETAFDGNTAALSGGAISSGKDNTNVFIMPGTLFTNNTVTGTTGSGGALFFNGNELVYIHSSFKGNKAYEGGAVALSRLNYGMSFVGCTFTENNASNGGGIFIGDGNGNGIIQAVSAKSINILDTSFYNNSASVDGGSVHVARVNSVTFTNPTFSGNIAGRDGGSIFIDSQNHIHINSSRFANNFASKFGGGMKSNYFNVISFYKGVLFHNNIADTEGGAIYAVSGSSVSFYDKANFLNNSCLNTKSRGGAISLHGESTISLLGVTTFVRNIAILYGGAIYSVASTIALGSDSCVFSDNEAGQGSALRLESMTTSAVMVAPSNSTDIVFMRNHCTMRGGTVSWTKDPLNGAGAFSVETIPHFSRFSWKKNTPVYGSQFSTQAVSLKSGGANVTAVSIYYANLPPPSISLLDYYAAQDVSDSSSVVSVSVARSSCINGVGYLSGVSAMTAVNGNATFDRLAAFCFPGGNMTLEYNGKYYHGFFIFEFILLCFISFLIF
jgi:predicted outer membrane repeat protein